MQITTTPLTMCGLCFSTRRQLVDGVICRPCIKLGPDGLAQREHRRAALLFRYAEREHLTTQQRQEILEAAELIERTARATKTIDRATWFSAKNYHELLKFSAMDPITGALQ